MWHEYRGLEVYVQLHVCRADPRCFYLLLLATSVLFIDRF